MSQLYKVTVHERIQTDGLTVFVDEGRPYTVEGTPMVRMSNVLVPADGWHSSKAAALTSAAERIEHLAHRLLAQAGRIRSDAAKEAAT